ncbi:MAG: BppU family phage baseplate upper protein [Acidimicrobiales bacterium]|nr:BppU family phage baseplate upper protein [Acidimicrobiales bacterium]
MPTTFHLKAGDLSPHLEATLVDGDGEPVPLDDIGELRFHMARGRTNPPLVDAEAVIIDAEAGTVRYEWAEGDTDAAGVYQAEFELRSGGDVTTFPNDAYLTIEIHERVAREDD